MKYVIANDGTVTAVVAGQTYTFNSDHPSYDKLLNNLKTGNVEYFEASYDIISRVNSFCEGYVSADGGEMTWDGIAMPDLFTDRILDMISQGFPFEPMLNFLDNLSQNPSDQAVVELFDFMQNKHLPITSDGHFLAYKAVGEDFTDLYSGSLDNSVGQTVEVPRSSVNSNRNSHCAAGLHVGAIDYAASYGGIDINNKSDDDGGNNLVICKVNPMDVVSVPSDSRFQKLRCCKYEVVSMFDNIFSSSVYMTENEIDSIKREKRTKEWAHEITSKLKRVKEVLEKVERYATV
ncbi:MAG: hypothetical protein FI729_03260 [SAR202 cluster bacterium]|nr:hypothetical protein [SAR202 cluster bacterium]|tara:strand:+ start:2458 stop:3330 length:873 start_codon:yes stop_codon:yes gene_type:complete